jgi:hypothetical protein
MNPLKKKAQVVMLSTQNKANIVYVTPRNILYYNKEGKELTKYSNPQHLYIIVDERPKSGEWYYDVRDNVLSNNSLGITFFSKKVIATTDTDLPMLIPDPIIGKAPIKFPQPSTSFIQNFILEYNNGNIITDVMVDYEWWYKDLTGEHLALMLNGSEFPKLKVDEKNFITITLCKESWNRDEIFKLFEELSYEMAQRIIGNRELEYPEPIVPHEWVKTKI